MTDTDVTENLKKIGMGALGERMGLEYISATLDEKGYATVTASMPVDGNTQPYGLLHGGANAVLAESIGSIASGLTAHTMFGEGHIVVGIDLNCTHHKSARSGLVVGVARIISAGKTIISSQIEIKDPDNRLICTARLTCVVRSVP